MHWRRRLGGLPASGAGLHAHAQPLHSSVGSPCAVRPPLCALQALKAANLPKNMKNMKGDISMNPRQMQQTMAKMSRALPPQVMQQLGGMSGLQSLMKGLEGGKLGGLGK